jgi:hypothetical protein
MTTFLAVLFMAGVADAQSLATSGQNLANSVATLHMGIANIPNIIAGVYYIIGAMMIGAGALKLKGYTENPTKEPLSHALGRLMAGAILIALPSFGEWLNSSLGIGHTTATPQSLGTIPP